VRREEGDGRDKNKLENKKRGRGEDIKKTSTERTQEKDAEKQRERAVEN
jgi:hypothetical protein